jgi:glycosyltransferase involved in cell wall biosynthesis
LLDSFAPDVVQVDFSEACLEEVHRRGIPIVSRIHNTYVAFGPGDWSSFRKTDRFVSHYAAVSSLARDYLIERSGIPGGKVSYVGNCVSMARLSRNLASPPAFTRRSLGLAEDDYVFLCVGTLDGRKGHSTLLRAFSQLAPKQRCAQLLCATS